MPWYRLDARLLLPGLIANAVLMYLLGTLLYTLWCRVIKKGCARQNASRVVAVRLDQSCGWEARRADRIGRDGFGLSTITTNSTRHLSHPPIQQTRQPSMRSPMATSLKSRRNLVSTCMATHAWLCEAQQSRPPATNFNFQQRSDLRVRPGTIWQGGLLFIDPTKPFLKIYTDQMASPRPVNKVSWSNRTRSPDRNGFRIKALIWGVSKARVTISRL
jgi:hypothetical protein